MDKNAIRLSPAIMVIETFMLDGAHKLKMGEARNEAVKLMLLEAIAMVAGGAMCHFVDSYKEIDEYDPEVNPDALDECVKNSIELVIAEYFDEDSKRVEDELRKVYCKDGEPKSDMWVGFYADIETIMRAVIERAGV